MLLPMRLLLPPPPPQLQSQAPQWARVGMRAGAAPLVRGKAPAPALGPGRRREGAPVGNPNAVADVAVVRLDAGSRPAAAPAAGQLLAAQRGGPVEATLSGDASSAEQRPRPRSLQDYRVLQALLVLERLLLAASKQELYPSAEMQLC